MKLTFLVTAYPLYASAKGPSSFSTLARWIFSSIVASSFVFLRKLHHSSNQTHLLSGSVLLSLG